MDNGRYQLGIDIGGTFTDLSLFDRQTGHLVGLKTPTIPANPAEGVRNGLGLLAERGVPVEEVIDRVLALAGRRIPANQ